MGTDQIEANSQRLDRHEAQLDSHERKLDYLTVTVYGSPERHYIGHEERLQDAEQAIKLVNEYQQKQIVQGDTIIRLAKLGAGLLSVTTAILGILAALNFMHP